MTGSLHPLSSTYTVSLPPLYGHDPIFVGVEVLGDHVLVMLLQPSNKTAFYLVSWKEGTVMPVNGLGRSHPFSGSGRTLKLRETPVIRQHRATKRSRHWSSMRTCSC